MSDGYDRPVLVQAPCGIVTPVSAEIGAGSGFALRLSRTEALALVGGSERWRSINPLVAAHVAQQERQELPQVLDADGDAEITISVRRRRP